MSSTGHPSISHFFKPKQTGGVGLKRQRLEDSKAKAEKETKRAQLAQSSTNAVNDEDTAQEVTIKMTHHESATHADKKAIEIIEIDLDDDVIEIPSNTDKLSEFRQSPTPSTKNSSQSESSTAPITNKVTPMVKSANPFAQFACSSSNEDVTANITARKATWKVHTNENPKANSNSKSSTKSPSSKSNGKKKEGFVKMTEISKEEQDRITKKWHSLAGPEASLEDRRYQVLLAARLHARCQEPTVRKAMAKLQEAMPDGVTAATVAKMDPEVLASHITNLQFYNVKAQQAVKAAQEIHTLFGGMVPEDELSLTKITGIGKCFADLLAFVNTRKKHEEAAAAKASDVNSTI